MAGFHAPAPGIERLDHPSFPGGLPVDAWISAAAAAARRFVAELKVRGAGAEHCNMSLPEPPNGVPFSTLPSGREGWRHPLPAGGVPSKEALAQNQALSAKLAAARAAAATLFGGNKDPPEEKKKEDAAPEKASEECRGDRIGTLSSNKRGGGQRRSASRGRRDNKSRSRDRRRSRSRSRGGGGGGGDRRRSRSRGRGNRWG